MALVVKNPPVIAGIWEMRVQFLGQKHSREGHGSPLHYSCLENPMDRRAWQTIVHRITQSQTWPKQLSTQERKTRKTGWRERSSNLKFKSLEKFPWVTQSLTLPKGRGSVLRKDLCGLWEDILAGKSKSKYPGFRNLLSVPGLHAMRSIVCSFLF